jgi:hypothetical protein
VHWQGGISAGHFAQNVLIFSEELMHRVAVSEFKPHVVILKEQRKGNEEAAFSQTCHHFIDYSLPCEQPFLHPEI